jgi:hypothetical protein
MNCIEKYNDQKGLSLNKKAPGFTHLRSFSQTREAGAELLFTAIFMQ